MTRPSSEDTEAGVGRREFLWTAAAAGATAVSGCASLEGGHADTRPNILLFCTDQQHWQALGKADPTFNTPHIDRLADEGVRFTSAYCTTPQCSASRSSLYTGFYPHKTTVIGNIGSINHLGEPIEGLPDTFETIGSRLRNVGYHTAYTGKWHLGNHDAFKSHFDIPSLDSDPRDGATAEAIASLDARAGDRAKPFALFVNYVNPHDIYQFRKLSEQGEHPFMVDTRSRPATWGETFEGKPPPQKRFMTDDQGACIWGKSDPWWDQYQALYREKCRLVDAQVGRVLGRLRELGLEENTIVVFTSDHGDMDTNHRLIFKGPFMYDHMVRVPLIIRVPERFGGVPPCLVDDFVVLTDIVPTLCDFAQAYGADTDGISLQPGLIGHGLWPQRDFVISQYYNKQRWVNPIRMIRIRGLKYNRYIDHGEELYNLQNDPEEMVNLAEDPGYQDVKHELGSVLRRWMRSQGDTAFDGYWSTNRDNTRFTTS